MGLLAGEPAQRGLVAERELDGEPSPGTGCADGRRPRHVALDRLLELVLGPGAGQLALIEENPCGESHIVGLRAWAVRRMAAECRPGAELVGQHRAQQPRLGDLQHGGGADQDPHPRGDLLVDAHQGAQAQRAGLGVVDRAVHRRATHRPLVELGEGGVGQLKVGQHLGAHADGEAGLPVGAGVLADDLDGLGVLIGPPGETGRRAHRPLIVDLQLGAVQPVDGLLAEVHRSEPTVTRLQAL